MDYGRVNLFKPGPEYAKEISHLAALTFAQTFVGKQYYTQKIVDGYATNSLSPDIFRENLLSSKHQFFLLEVGGVLAGFAQIVERDSPHCVEHLNAIYLNRLYLKSEFHGSGFGKMLLFETFKEAKIRGFDWVWLSVWEHNFSARAFYDRFGFKNVGEWEWSFESDGLSYVDRDFIYIAEIPSDVIEY